MKIQKPVLKETKHIAIGLLIADCIMCVVFALLKKFNYTVVLGALLGSAFAIGNFFLLGLALQKALELGDGAAKYMHASYTRRMLLFVVCIAVGVLVRCFHPVAVILPLFFPRLVIFAMQALGMYTPEKKQPNSDRSEKNEENPEEALREGGKAE